MVPLGDWNITFGEIFIFGIVVSLVMKYIFGFIGSSRSGKVGSSRSKSKKSPNQESLNKQINKEIYKDFD